MDFLHFKFIDTEYYANFHLYILTLSLIRGIYDDDEKSERKKLDAAAAEKDVQEGRRAAVFLCIMVLFQYVHFR